MANVNAGAREGSGAMFDGIAARYDMVNRIMSFGLDRRWRDRTVRSLELGDKTRVLDLATGTADLAIAIARKHEAVRVTGTDPSPGMLDVAATKLTRFHLSERITLAAGDARQLDFPDSAFDAVSIAFGIRNVPDRGAALREMSRVCRPGGRVAILELCEPDGALLGTLARFYVHTVVPRIGAFLSRMPAYQYLQRSIAAFPAPGVFADEMRGAGLDVLEVTPLTFGACCLFVATPSSSSTGSGKAS